jgi:hypothetical protein
MTAGCVALSDFDLDGDVDVFFGGRAIPRSYGISPRSFLLKNSGKGIFEDIADQVDGLAFPGMIRDASWTDLNGDGQPDLIMACEWGPVLFFINQQGRFAKA